MCWWRQLSKDGSKDRSKDRSKDGMEEIECLYYNTPPQLER